MYRRLPTRPGLYRLKDRQGNITVKFTPKTRPATLFDPQRYTVEKFNGREWVEYD